MDPAVATEPTEVPVTPPVEPSPPDPSALLEQERLRSARLEGELAALRAAPKAPPPPSAAPMTPELVHAAFEKGEITQLQRDLWIADYQAEIRLQHQRTLDATAEAQRRAESTLTQYLAAYPDLAKPDSALMRQVGAELQAMVREEGADAQDVRVQVRAVKSVLGALRTKDPRDFQRERIPAGSQSFSPGGGGPTEPKGDPLAHVSPAQLAHWRRLGYSEAEMVAEAPFVKVRSA